MILFYFTEIESTQKKLLLQNITSFMLTGNNDNYRQLQNEKPIITLQILPKIRFDKFEFSVEFGYSLKLDRY